MASMSERKRAKAEEEFMEAQGHLLLGVYYAEQCGARALARDGLAITGLTVEMLASHTK